MGNRGNFDDFDDFNDDLFNDNDDDNLRGGFDDDFDNLDDDFNDFDDIDDAGDDSFDDDGFDEEENGGGGPSRVFIFLALLVTLGIIGGIVALLFFVNRDTGPSEVEITSTAIAEFNATQEFFLQQTQTQSVEFQIATETAVVVQATETVAAQQTADAAAILAATQEALVISQTEAALIAQATADALATEQAIIPLPEDPDAAETPIAIGPALTETALAQATPIPPTNTPSTGLSAADILLTSTALAQTLSPQIVVTEVPDAQATRPPVFPTPPTTLPDTGLFDDITGAGGMGTIFLLAIGLIGVIVVSRRLRR